VTIRKLLAILTFLLVCSSTWAATSHDCGPYVLRHRVVTSDSLSPESAAMLGVKPSANTAVINIMLLSKSTRETLSGRVHVVIKRTSGLMHSLKLRTIKSHDEAMFYVAEFEYNEGEKLEFELSVSALGQPPQSFSFSQTLR